MWCCFHHIKQTNKRTTELLESSEPRNPLITMFFTQFLPAHSIVWWAVSSALPASLLLPALTCSYLPAPTSVFTLLVPLLLHPLLLVLIFFKSLLKFYQFGVAFPNTRSIHALWGIPRVAIEWLSIRRSQLRASYVISSAKFE